MKDLIFVNSHPIQYFAPLYKYMNEKGMKVQAWYCSDESVKGVKDSEFGVEVKWDIPLLEGYEYLFFTNHSWKPSLFNGFFGLMNFGIVKKLFKQPKSVIVVHGWHYFSHLLILLLARLKGHIVCIRSDMSYNQELLKSGWKQKIKRAGLKYFVFPRINYFLYIGTQNRLFYKSYGIAEARLLSCPYSVDNNRFRNESKKLKLSAADIRQRMGVPVDGKIILCTAKYIDKKRPLDLLQAFSQLHDVNCWLIMVGEGELRKEMEEFIKTNKLKQVILTGFVNQSAIAEYYAITDVFVMCSSVGENWGLSVNEAMNFDLPVIVSDLTGCSDDLVKDGVNGYVFKTGKVDELAAKLKLVLGNKLSWDTSSERIIDEYSYSSLIENISPVIK